MKIPYNILIQIKMSVRPYFKGFTLIFSSITVENRSIAYFPDNYEYIIKSFLHHSCIYSSNRLICPSM